MIYEKKMNQGEKRSKRNIRIVTFSLTSGQWKKHEKFSSNAVITNNFIFRLLSGVLSQVKNLVHPRVPLLIYFFFTVYIVLLRMLEKKARVRTQLQITI